jgi:hypothetical protein
MKTLFTISFLFQIVSAISQCNPNDILRTTFHVDNDPFNTTEYVKYTITNVSSNDLPVIYYSKDGYWHEVDFPQSKIFYWDTIEKTFVFYGPKCATYAHGDGDSQPKKFDEKKPKFKVE